MKVTAHVMVCRKYNLALLCSQWLSDVEAQAEERNKERFSSFGDDDSSEYLNHDKDSIAVSVEFEVPDDMFLRLRTPTIQGQLK